MKVIDFYARCCSHSDTNTYAQALYSWRAREGDGETRTVWAEPFPSSVVEQDKYTHPVRIRIFDNFTMSAQINSIKLNQMQLFVTMLLMMKWICTQLCTQLYVSYVCDLYATIQILCASLSKIVSNRLVYDQSRWPEICIYPFRNSQTLLFGSPTISSCLCCDPRNGCTHTPSNWKKIMWTMQELSDENKRDKKKNGKSTLRSLTIKMIISCNLCACTSLM